MALSYDDLGACALFVKQKLGVTDDDLDTLIEASAALENGQPYYGRPYKVAALLLSRQAHDDVLTKAKSGVTLGDPERTIKGWLELQSAIDRAKGWTVPAGFEAVAAGSTVRLRSAVPVVVNF